MIRVGLVGCGAFGLRHAKTWGIVPDALLCAVFDPIPKRARAAAAESGAAVAGSLEDLLIGVDAVSVVTPMAFHSDVVRQCLTAGRHVLVEKPLGDRPQEAQELARLADAEGRILMVGYLERFHPWIRAAISALPSPRRIEARRINCRPPDDPSAGIVHDVMSHDIELATRWIDVPVAEVAAAGRRNGRGIIDEVAAELRFADGRTASLLASWRGTVRRREVKAIGDGNEQCIDLLDQGHGIDLLHRELASFASAVRDDSKPPVSGIDAARALSIAMQVVDALRVSEEA